MKDFILNDRHQYFSIYKSACTKCKWFDSENIACPAFKEIPEEILSGENNHSKPVPGQTNSITFTAK